LDDIDAAPENDAEPEDKDKSVTDDLDEKSAKAKETEHDEL
jgi:hypothetical protein